MHALTANVFCMFWWTQYFACFNVHCLCFNMPTPSLTYSYLISPIKMRSLWEDKNHPKNTGSLLIFGVHLVCFISNIYKQRFSWLVKFSKKLSNETSLLKISKQLLSNNKLVYYLILINKIKYFLNFMNLLIFSTQKHYKLLKTGSKIFDSSTLYEK